MHGTLAANRDTFPSQNKYCYGKGGCLSKGEMMFNHASGQLLPEHTWIPRCAQNFSWTHLQYRKTSGQRLHEHTRNLCHLDLHPHTITERCSCGKTAAFARHKHTWISLRAQRDVPAKRLLRSHAASTLGSLSVRKQTCSRDSTAAFARCEHTWISLRAQRGMFRRKNCCVLTPGAQLDFAPCTRRPVHATTLLRSHAASTLGSHSVRKAACSGEASASFPLREHTWISLRAQKECSIKRLLHSHAASTLGSRFLRKLEDMFMRQHCCVRTL